MIWLLWLAVLALLTAAAACCFRISSWHQQESDFWYGVHDLWLADPATTDATYLPVLVWKKAHPPTLWERVRGWRPPTERRGGAA